MSGEAEGKIEEVKWKRWFPETFEEREREAKFLSCREIERKSSDRRRRGRLPHHVETVERMTTGPRRGRRGKEKESPLYIADETGAIYFHHCHVSLK